MFANHFCVLFLSIKPTPICWVIYSWTNAIVCLILGAPYGPGQPAYNQYPAPDQYGPPPQQGQYPPQPNQFPPNTGQRMYPPYGPPAENES